MIPKDATDAQVYICSLNGVAETGELVNIDGGEMCIRDRSTGCARR